MKINKYSDARIWHTWIANTLNWYLHVFKDRRSQALMKTS